MAAAVWTECTNLTVLQKKVEPRRELFLLRGFAVLWAFLRGVLGKGGESAWFFVVKLW
jgi:hypothetical protein